MVSMESCSTRRVAVFDIEANGLQPTEIWCLSKEENGRLVSTTKYSLMRSFLTSADVLI